MQLGHAKHGHKTQRTQPNQAFPANPVKSTGRRACGRQAKNAKQRDFVPLMKQRDTEKRAESA